MGKRSGKLSANKVKESELRPAQGKQDLRATCLEGKGTIQVFFFQLGTDRLLSLCTRLLMTLLLVKPTIVRVSFLSVECVLFCLMITRANGNTMYSSSNIHVHAGLKVNFSVHLQSFAHSHSIKLILCVAFCGMGISFVSSLMA